METHDGLLELMTSGSIGKLVQRVVKDNTVIEYILDNLNCVLFCDKDTASYYVESTIKHNATVLIGRISQQLVIASNTRLLYKMMQAVFLRFKERSEIPICVTFFATGIQKAVTLNNGTLVDFFINNYPSSRRNKHWRKHRYLMFKDAIESSIYNNNYELCKYILNYLDDNRMRYKFDKHAVSMSLYCKDTRIFALILYSNRTGNMFNDWIEFNSVDINANWSRVIDIILEYTKERNHDFYERLLENIGEDVKQKV